MSSSLYYILMIDKEIQARDALCRQQEATTDGAVQPFPWPRGDPSPFLLPQGHKVLYQEPTGTENMQNGAEMGLISLFDRIKEMA